MATALTPSCAESGLLIEKRSWNFNATFRLLCLHPLGLKAWFLCAYVCVCKKYNPCAGRLDGQIRPLPLSWINGIYGVPKTFELITYRWWSWWGTRWDTVCQRGWLRRILSWRGRFLSWLMRPLSLAGISPLCSPRQMECRKLCTWNERRLKKTGDFGVC